MSTSVKEPAPRNYYNETRDSLQAQIDLNPKLLKSEQSTRPDWTALELATMDQALNGVGGQRGLVDMYGELAPKLGAIDAAGNSQQRSADIADVARLGPEALAAMRAANPGQWKLIDELTKQAQGDLEAGSTMTPAMQREIAQFVAQGQAARGLTAGPAEVYQEAMTLGTAGQELLARRRAFAAGVADMNQRFAGDPFLQIAGRSSGAVTSARGVAGDGGGVGSNIGAKLFNPESQYAADLAQGNYEGTLAARTASASSRAGLFGGLLSAGGLLGGSAIKKWG